MTNTQERIQNYERYIESKEDAIVKCQELAESAEQWKNKLIDKNFFEQDRFKLVTDEGYTHFKYHMRRPEYSYRGSQYVVYLNRDYSLELKNRETAHVLECIHTMLAFLQTEIEECKKNIAELRNFNEDDLVKDLQALYVKYNRPEVWGKVLESYEVRYPEQ